MPREEAARRPATPLEVSASSRPQVFFQQVTVLLVIGLFIFSWCSKALIPDDLSKKAAGIFDGSAPIIWPYLFPVKKSGILKGFHDL